jgi:hypothetical protein
MACSTFVKILQQQHNPLKQYQAMQALARQRRWETHPNVAALEDHGDRSRLANGLVEAINLPLHQIHEGRALAAHAAATGQHCQSTARAGRFIERPFEGEEIQEHVHTVSKDPRGRQVVSEGAPQAHGSRLA